MLIQMLFLYIITRYNSGNTEKRFDAKMTSSLKKQQKIISGFRDQSCDHMRHQLGTNQVCATESLTYTAQKLTKNLFRTSCPSIL